MDRLLVGDELHVELGRSVALGLDTHALHLTFLPLEDAALHRGAELAHRARALYAHCTATGEWPGYPPEVALVSLPPYAFRDREDFL